MILKALAMSTLAERMDRAAASGYWAVEIRLDTADRGLSAQVFEPPGGFPLPHHEAHLGV